MAFKKVTRTIPIVYIGATDPVDAGLVDSFAHPGGNITGFTTMGAVLAGKRLELLTETVPRVSRVGVLWNPRNRGSEETWKETQNAARKLGLQLHSMQVTSAEQYPSAFQEAVAAGSTTLIVRQTPPASANRKQIADLAKKYRLPALFDRDDFVRSGGLMSYGPDPTEPYRRGASMVDRILKGSKPADLPIERPTKFELVINLKTAKQIGVTIPPNVLARADRVIR
jgi:putative ABC transport system substrate-binding protein